MVWIKLLYNTCKRGMAVPMVDMWRHFWMSPYPVKDFGFIPSILCCRLSRRISLPTGRRTRSCNLTLNLYFTLTFNLYFTLYFSATDTDTDPALTTIVVVVVVVVGGGGSVLVDVEVRAVWWPSRGRGWGWDPRMGKALGTVAYLEINVMFVLTQN